nr:ribosome silencing factor [Mobiluncus porci]
MSADPQAIELAILAGQAAKEKKATEVLALDVSERLVLTDMFLLASGANERQVRAIVDAIDEVLTRHGVKLLRREGFQEARWVLLDYGSLVVHVQHEEDRQFYALERLWADAPVVEIPDPDLALKARAEAVAAGQVTAGEDAESVVQGAGPDEADSAKAMPFAEVETGDSSEPKPVSPLDFLDDNY